MPSHLPHGNPTQVEWHGSGRIGEPEPHPAGHRRRSWPALSGRSLPRRSRSSEDVGERLPRPDQSHRARSELSASPRRLDAVGASRRQITMRGRLCAAVQPHTSAICVGRSSECGQQQRCESGCRRSTCGDIESHNIGSQCSRLIVPVMIPEFGATAFRARRAIARDMYLLLDVTRTYWRPLAARQVSNHHCFWHSLLLHASSVRLGLLRVASRLHRAGPTRILAATTSGSRGRVRWV